MKQKQNTTQQLRIIKTIEPKKINTVGIHPGICFRCKKEILLGSNYLKLITMNDSEIHEEVWFHLLCWQEFNQEKVTQRLQETLNLGLNLFNTNR